MDAMNGVSSSKIKIIPQSRFEPPIVTHFIDSLTNIKSLMMCGILCDRHIICRTADYNSIEKTCRLFETLTSLGTILNDSTTSILPINNCVDDMKTEPEYVCTRSGAVTVQNIFDRLVLANNIILASSDRGSYVNMYGIYTSSSTGYISFFTDANVRTILKTGTTNTNDEITSINSAPSNGLSTVQYFKNLSIIYKNTGNQSSPQLVQTFNITLSDRPYSCVTTTEYVYITYAESYTAMTIHNISTGSILYKIPRNISTFRPVISQWNNSITIADGSEIKEYDLTGTYKSTLSYSHGFPNRTFRNYIYDDYGGRRYICNLNGENSGIFVFLQNSTQIANKSISCLRAFQLYLTKDQAIFINTPNVTIKQIIYF